MGNMPTTKAAAIATVHDDPSASAHMLACPECGSADLHIERTFYSEAYARLDEHGLWQLVGDEWTAGEPEARPVVCAECGADHDELDVLAASGLFDGETTDEGAWD